MKIYFNKKSFPESTKEYLYSRKEIPMVSVISFVLVSALLLLLNATVAFGWMFWGIVGMFFFSSANVTKRGSLNFDDYVCCFPFLICFASVTNIYAGIYHRRNK